MGIVSYAQKLEDVMLWRALKDVENGFYIDIGANHPKINSATKVFYESGWNGINIGPKLELFNDDRPRDLNLNLAVSSKDKDSFTEVRTINALSLDKLCENLKINEVHFLKVHVKGVEKDALKGFSFDTVRPWICVVEATKPTTQIDGSDEWENILFEHDYIFSYFDGLNKYYVAEEHKNLVGELKIATKAETRTNDVLHELGVLGKFVRWFFRGVYHWITFSPTSHSRKVLKKILISSKNYINTKPKIKNRLMLILNRFPNLKERLRKIGKKKYVVSPEYGNLTSRANEIYLKLKIAIEEKKEIK